MPYGNLNNLIKEDDIINLIRDNLKQKNGYIRPSLPAEISKEARENLKSKIIEWIRENEIIGWVFRMEIVGEIHLKNPRKILN